MALPGTSGASLGELGDRTLSKVRRRVLPLMIWLYFIAFLDRNNVGFAKLTMSEDIGLSATAYGLGAGIFFIGYAIFEVPSNAGMHRFGARKWIARILVTWGFFATAMAAVQGETTFYIIRFLLGAAEAGFFPAVILYLTYWFPAAQRVAVLGLFILAQPLANAIGAPVSGLLLKMDGIWGLQGWQWMYIIEGLPAMIMGVVVLCVVTDRPRDAMWLAPEERSWLQDTMDAEDAAKSSRRRPQLRGRAQGPPGPDLRRAVLRSGDGHLRAEPVAALHRQGDGRPVHHAGRVHRPHPLHLRRPVRPLLEPALRPHR